MSPNLTRARLGRPLTSPMRKTPRGRVRGSSADLISNIISVDLRCDFRWTQLANFSRLQRRHERHGARFFEQTRALHLRARCGPRPRARSGCRTEKAAVGRTSSREGALFHITWSFKNYQEERPREMALATLASVVRYYCDSCEPVELATQAQVGLQRCCAIRARCCAMRTAGDMTTAL